MLGFAMRAGKLVIGTELVCRSMAKRGRDSVKLVLVSSSASAGTKKKLLTKCEFYKLSVIVISMDSSELGRLLGKTYAPSAVAITDIRFAEEIAKAHASEQVPQDFDGQRDQTTQRKEVSYKETGDSYAAITSENNTDI